MTELILIILHLFFIMAFFSINPLIFNKKLNNTIATSLTENILLNFLITGNFILILSYFNLNLSEIIKFYSIYFFGLCIFFLKNKFLNFSKTKINYVFDFIIIFLISIIICIDISNKLILSWDSEKFWLYKKLSFYNNFSIENLKNMARPEYPFLGGLIGSFFWKLSFIGSEYASRLYLGLVYAIAIYSLVENISVPKIYKFVILFLFVLITYDYHKLFNGNQEILIFSLICFTLSSCYKIKYNKNIVLNFIIILLSCNLLVWTKQEGLFYIFFIMITTFFVFKFSSKEKIYFFILLLSLIILRIYIFKVYNFEITLNKNVVNELSFQVIISSLDIQKSLVILKYLIFAIFQNLYLLFGLILILLNRIIDNKTKYINVYLLINITFIYVVYLLVNDADRSHEFLLKFGIERLLFNISPIVILLFVETLDKKKNLFYKNNS